MAELEARAGLARHSLYTAVSGSVPLTLEVCSRVSSGSGSLLYGYCEGIRKSIYAYRDCVARPDLGHIWVVN